MKIVVKSAGNNFMSNKLITNLTAEDKAENEKKVDRIESHSYEYKSVASEALQVGDIVRIQKDDVFPADLLLITSCNGHKQAYCDVDTSNINGNSQLERKISPPGFDTMPALDSAVRTGGKLEARDKDKVNILRLGELKNRLKSSSIEYDTPNKRLDAWKGNICVGKPL